MLTVSMLNALAIEERKKEKKKASSCLSLGGGVGWCGVGECMTRAISFVSRTMRSSQAC